MHRRRLNGFENRKQQSSAYEGFDIEKAAYSQASDRIHEPDFEDEEGENVWNVIVVCVYVIFLVRL